MSQQFHHIASLLKPEELVQLEQWTSMANFVDGKTTAGMAARDVKNNLQLENERDSTMKPIQDLLQNVIQSSPFFQAAAQPKKIHPFIISKYKPGNYYGWHIDSPVMGEPPVRTDLAMTVFLNDPSSYEGGELVIQTSAGQMAVKPAKGDAIIYPCQFLHCVNEIKTGERLAAVTWIESRIRSAEQRQLLFDLHQAYALVLQKDKQAPEANLLLQSYSNLTRMWTDV